MNKPQSVSEIKEAQIAENWENVYFYLAGLIGLFPPFAIWLLFIKRPLKHKIAVLIGGLSLFGFFTLLFFVFL